MSPLSAREREVLLLIAEGKSMKEIATLLFISVKAVETHRMRLKGKLDIHETAGRYAIRQGIIEARSFASPPRMSGILLRELRFGRIARPRRV